MDMQKQVLIVNAKIIKHICRFVEKEGSESGAKKRAEGETPILELHTNFIVVDQNRKSFNDQTK